MAVHDINNWLRFPCAKKPYADSTLRSKTKSELIQILRDYEHNYEVLWQANERGIKAAQEMLQKAGRWISVKERMPEDGKNVLAYEGGGFFYIDWCVEGEWVIAGQSCGVVTHWMPLPEPPKEMRDG